MKETILVHGGTALRATTNEDEMVEALDKAMLIGQEMLAHGAHAVDAVVEAIADLESCGLFIAGRGGQSQSDGVIRYDASVSSSDGRAGAVVGIVGVSAPIRAARLIWEKIGHTTLCGVPATHVIEALGISVNWAAGEPTTSVAECLALHMQQSSAMFTTVGAVAVDQTGRLAAGTSTAGYLGALPGRTGDSGAIGVGTLASQRMALSATGDGDAILRSALAGALDGYIEAGKSSREACDMALARLTHHCALGGFIVLTSDGMSYVRCNVPILRYRCSTSVNAVFHSEG